MQHIQKAMPKYYTYNQQKYSICFPLEWAINHFEKTGPNECTGCRKYGCDDSIFKQYCNNCQLYEYMGTRTTEEYCHAAMHDQVQCIDLHESINISNVYDYSDDSEDSLIDYHYLDEGIYTGLDECKLSMSSLDGEESISRSSVMPIFQEYFDDSSIINMEVYSGYLHDKPTRT